MSRIGSWLASDAADALQSDARFRYAEFGSRRTPYPFASVLSGQSVVKFTSVLDEEAA
jgi:hypothetical protein